MFDNKEKNIHKNHRKRLLDTVYKSGLENVSDIVALEFVLNYLIPRKDTNPLAHRLIEEFGNFSAVFDADVERLEKIDGLGERSAKLLTLLPQVFYRYKFEKLANKKYLKSRGDILDFYLALYDNKSKEEFYITCLDTKNRIIANKKISQGDMNSLKIDKKELSKLMINSGASKVILSHCHPDGVCQPSCEDISSTKCIIDIANMLGIAFVDHIIVGIDGCYSYARLDKIKDISRY
ncbi:MAG: JAB domain-containing protein [Clostridia bacterium]|nr:JAB domain-containing protein [Clostridia bacterium]